MGSADLARGAPLARAVSRVTRSGSAHEGMPTPTAPATTCLPASPARGKCSFQHWNIHTFISSSASRSPTSVSKQGFPYVFQQTQNIWGTIRASYPFHKT